MNKKYVPESTFQLDMFMHISPQKRLGISKSPLSPKLGRSLSLKFRGRCKYLWFFTVRWLCGRRERKDSEWERPCLGHRYLRILSQDKPGSHIFIVTFLCPQISTLYISSFISPRVSPNPFSTKTKDWNVCFCWRSRVKTPTGSSIMEILIFLVESTKSECLLFNNRAKPINRQIPFHN